MALVTFMEMATQNGFVVAQMTSRMDRSRDSYKLVNLGGAVRQFQMFKALNPDIPVFVFDIPNREPAESVRMWEDKCKKILDKAWKLYKAERALRRSPPSIVPSLEPSESDTSSLGASSTDAPQKSESLSTMLPGEVPEPSVSVPEPLIPESLKTEPLSSRTSKPRSRKSGSKSRSSSTKSTSGSGSDTALPESTSQSN